MQKIVINQTGGTEQLNLVDFELGTPGAGEVQIKHTAIGLNFIDVYFRTGLYPAEKPFTPGMEAAGIVEQVGEGVTNVKSGDRVVYCGALGAYATHRNIAADKLVPIPDGVSDDISAASLLKGLTAHYLLFLTYKLKKGDAMFVQAAAGGVGSILCQWGKHLGGYVIGAVGSDEKVPLAKENGCDVVINLSNEDFVEKVREATDGKGVPVVYDSLGKDTFEKSLDCLQPHGLMVSYGNATGPVSIPDLGILSRKGSLYVVRPKLFDYTNTHEELVNNANALFDVIQKNVVKVNIGQKFDLKDIAKAHNALENRQTTGSTIILP
ncbi:quinone oxidoreductase family protein [Maritalea mediterranea]|uniref:Quinone oxidoreductase n=1 Tax=Maritalea mediterranea TaxID=2909667 RepID=A0ABS9E633_9HYPH|nr:quinone oxidoreductase [Maritalea mediterranea]MCF4098329.1 quinone oxidoreductase [Maritalea mediterranea]